MLIERYTEEDVFARVPEVATQTDPVLRHLDRLLDDDLLFSQVKADLARRHPRTLLCGRHSTPVEVILRLRNWPLPAGMTPASSSAVAAATRRGGSDDP